MQAVTDFVMVILRKSRGWILEDKVSVYKPIGREARMLRMNLNSSILDLRHIVVQKLNMKNMAFGLRYAVPGSEELIEIVDDDDVYNFLTYAHGKTPNLVTLFVELDYSEDVSHSSGGRNPINVGRGERKGYVFDYMMNDANDCKYDAGLDLDLNLDIPSQYQHPLRFPIDPQCKIMKPDQPKQQHKPQFLTDLRYDPQPQIQNNPEQKPQPQRQFQTNPTKLPQRPKAANRVEPTATQSSYRPYVPSGSEKVHAPVCKMKVPLLVHDESTRLHGEHDEDFLNCTKSTSSLIRSVNEDECESDSYDDPEVEVESDEETPEPSRRGASKGREGDDRGNVPYRKGVDYLGSMPPPLADQKTSKPFDVPMNRARMQRIKVLQTFNSKKDLKVALGMNCLEKAFGTKTKKRQSGRPPIKDRIPSKEEFRKPKQCGRCKKYGHLSSKCVTREEASQSDPKSPNKTRFSFEGLMVPSFMEM